MSELTMSKAQREAFLADVHVGVITVARDGAAPLAAPVWYTYEPGGDVLFVFDSASEKVTLLEATGRASLCVQTETVPYRYVTVEGPVVVSDADAEVERSMAHRYLGAEMGDVYLRTSAGSASRVARLTPRRWRTVDYTPFVERVLGASG
jgi:PPOX class probable F420-dependent enzyme